MICPNCVEDHTVYPAKNKHKKTPKLGTPLNPAQLQANRLVSETAIAMLLQPPLIQ